MSRTPSPTSSDGAPLRELPRAGLAPERWPTRILTELGTLLDGSVLRAVPLVIERALVPDAEDLRAVRESAATMLAPELQRDPGRFFEFPEVEPDANLTRGRPRLRLRGGVVLERRIESGYAPFSAEAPAADRTPLRFEHWRHHRGRSRATLVALHGFAMGRPRLDGVALFASEWYRRGLDVALPTLPYHGERAPPGSRLSGEPFATPDVGRLSEAVREAIWEIRLTTRLLREETGRPVGLLGVSLGGYLTALAAGLQDDLDFAIPWSAPVCMGDLAWRFFSRTRHAREGGAAALSRDELRRAFRVHSPLSHPLRIPRERTLILARRGDRIVPPEHPLALWRHWGEPTLHWFSGSHLAPFGRGRIVDAIARHLASLRIL